ncbi:STAS domain-containing protein [Mycobacterium sp. ACS4331]|uniref:STAS domain-containing protein n=1 Tax=Mycobacterium sp. ACS4331 TaxID=1834121 RepID=UPI0007FD7883|nr:STAS domain-containing protein [Mycobacterium sp. ACS4331]OBF21533.1 hypothetical protein A5727_08585 [Mycobacterium sp. ACS4331]
MATPLTLCTRQLPDGTPVLQAVGELDLSNIAAFGAAVAQTRATAPRDTRVTLDLSEVTYLDSGAINVLFDHVDAVDIVVHRDLIAVLKISGLSDLGSVRSAP